MTEIEVYAAALKDRVTKCVNVQEAYYLAQYVTNDLEMIKASTARIEAVLDEIKTKIKKTKTTEQ